MTNTLTISRELAERLDSPHSSVRNAAIESLRQILAKPDAVIPEPVAAPVVERQQPVAIVTGSSVQWLPGAGSVRDRAELYTAPPELAELQARSDNWKSKALEAAATALQSCDDIAELQSTIARLTAENERLREAHEQVCTNYNKVSYASEERGKEIERLKGGRGEPVALQHVAVAEGGKLRWMTGRKMQECELYAMPYGSPINFPVYTSQPAPVAVVLPDRDAFEAWRDRRNAAIAEHGGSSSWYVSQAHYATWEACLDKVKELNQ